MVRIHLRAPRARYETAHGTPTRGFAAAQDTDTRTCHAHATLTPRGGRARHMHRHKSRARRPARGSRVQGERRPGQGPSSEHHLARPVTPVYLALGFDFGFLMSLAVAGFDLGFAAGFAMIDLWG